MQTNEQTHEQKTTEPKNPKTPIKSARGEEAVAVGAERSVDEVLDDRVHRVVHPANREKDFLGLGPDVDSLQAGFS